MEETYEQSGGHEPTTGLGLDNASNILVLEQSSTGGEAACFDLLTASAPDDSALLIISLDWSLDQWLEAWWRQVGDNLPANVGFICVDKRRKSSKRGFDSPSIQQSFDVTTISDPSNLTKVGIMLTNYVSEWAKDDQQSLVCLRSLMAILMHTDVQATYRFLHTMTGFIRSNQAIAHYHVDPKACDEQTLNKIKTLFDTFIEVDADGNVSVVTR